MQADLGEFRRRNVAVVAIGQGTGEQAAHYCNRAQAGFPCLGDPARSGYRALGLARGSWWSVVLRALVTRPVDTLRQIAKADLAASRLEASDVLQLSGVAIVAQGGELRFLHVAESPEDIPANREIFRALDLMEA